MPRRKQQEPRRAAAYVPKVEIKGVTFDEETLQDDGLSLDSQEAEYLCNEEEEEDEEDSVKGFFTPQNSPLSNGTNPDAGYASPLSDASDQIADHKSTSSKEEKEEVPSCMGNGDALQDSLAQMKAVYANLISDASWSRFAVDIIKTKPVSSSNVKNHTPSTTPPDATDTTDNSNHSQKSSAVNSLNGIAGSTITLVNSCISNNSNSSASNGGSMSYDWHQAALAKTLQQTPYHLLPEPNLFSTVQLYRQNNKLYGSVFTGASKFRCKDCSAAYDTLVGLTVHMNETGHYRDNNKDQEEDGGKCWSKPRKRSLMEMESKEDAQKVLKCMYCGHSFESLQDLSVHMIKTKHYQKVPLKEPVPALATKLAPAAKKRSLQDTLNSPCSPESNTGSSGAMSEFGKDGKGTTNPYVTPNNRYGYQNGASYTWQFEARKSQILKCMECGSSHDTLQQLTAHMMVTGHFLKVTNTASKKGKHLVFDPVIEEKVQSIPLPPTTTRLPVPSLKSLCVSPALSADSDGKKETEETKIKFSELVGKRIKEEKETNEKVDMDFVSYKYLREEDIEESPKGGMDILKSLENTVSSAISKAQTGTPTWGGYPSIHAAYQLQGSMKSSLLPPTVQSVPVQPAFNSGLRTLVADPEAVIYPPHSPSLPSTLRNNVSAMEDLVEKVTGKVSIKKEKEEWMVNAEPACVSKSLSPVLMEKSDTGETVRSHSSNKTDRDVVFKIEPKDTLVESHNDTKNGIESCRSLLTSCNSLEIITDHSPERPFLSPLSALQSVMNTHLSKASKPVNPSSDRLSVSCKISNNVMDKPMYYSSSKQNESHKTYFYEDNDQPMDLRKSKSKSNDGTYSNTSSHPVVSHNVNGSRSFNQGIPFIPASSVRENALMDISDMVKSLTDHLAPKSSTPSSISEKSDADGSVFEDTLEDLSSLQKRKGRQSNWNPLHLLILQAQFASSLRETPEGRYAMTDLDPQERVHICKFTGLSMTTISHWLANVKYQLRRTGGTKFLKNMDTSQPVFLCGDCASQFRTPSSYISHLETHLGFSLKDLSKLSVHHLLEQQAVSKVIMDKVPYGSPLLNLTSLDEDLSPGSIYQCRLCNRTFVSKHAIKLHLSKTHGKSPEDHLMFVTTLEKIAKSNNEATE
ncbi:teashirt homolog 1-like [Salminus brasiliensis]|uniref:teashirt homolog 1-like n=1 Tax=Salminus brasiliensis TaxID=930266 RepID=UPI003B82E5D1